MGEGTTGAASRKGRRVHGRTGLVLGGGAARGWAHVGVLRALDEAGIRPDVVVGTSIGALVGAIYASGGMEAIERAAGRLQRQRALPLLDLVVPRSGLMDGHRMTEALREFVTATDIRDFPVEFAAVATDLVTGRGVVLAEGDPIEAVRASISVPGLFTPVLRDGAVLVDGGLVDPVPVGVARSLGAEFVIAVDISSGVGAEGPYLAARTLDGGAPWLMEVLLSTAAVTGTALAGLRLERDRPEVLLRPAVGHIQFLNFGRAVEAIEAGYECARSLRMRGDVRKRAAAGSPASLP